MMETLVLVLAIVEDTGRLRSCRRRRLPLASREA